MWAGLLVSVLLGCEAAVPPPAGSGGGFWDARQANTLMLTALADHGRDADAFFEDPAAAEGRPAIHQWVNTFALPGEPTRYVGVFTTTFEGNDCHGCAPVVSIFELTPTPTPTPVSDPDAATAAAGGNGLDAAWRISHRGIAVAQLGSWGVLTGPVGVLPLGGDRYGVTLRGGGTFQGITQSFIEVWIPVEDGYQLALRTPYAVSDTSDRDWGEWWAELSAHPRDGQSTPGSGYADLVLRRTSEPNPQLEDRYDLPAQQRFRFDGRSYQPLAAEGQRPVAAED